MQHPEQAATSTFERARVGLWNSLQLHLAALHQAESKFLAATGFAESFPFSTGLVPFNQLDEYWKQRHAFRDLFTDETSQLSTLVKAVRTKGYAEDEKKQLYLLILGYMDLLSSTVGLLDTHVPTALPDDAELADTAVRFDRLKKLVRLSVRGVSGLMGF